MALLGTPRFQPDIANQPAKCSGAEGALAALWTEYKNKVAMGPAMQELPVRHCAEFAKSYDFFFYTGQGGRLTRMMAV
jgi:hypothetical protein